MAEATPYTIGQLAELAGVTPRTIRYYTAEGLLPRPDARGQYALYGEEHLLRLQLIAQLKETYLPLGEIKARIENLDDAQIRALLDDQRELARAAGQRRRLPGAGTRPPAGAAIRAPPGRARRVVRGCGNGRCSACARPPHPAPAAPAPAAPAYGFATPIAAPGRCSATNRGSGGSTAAAVGLLRKLMPQRAARRPTLPLHQAGMRRRASSAGGASSLRPASSCIFASRLAPAFHERIDRLMRWRAGFLELMIDA